MEMVQIPDAFLKGFITGVETWHDRYDHESIAHLKQWREKM